MAVGIGGLGQAVWDRRWSPGYSAQAPTETEGPFDIGLDLARAARSFRDELKLGNNGHSKTFYVLFSGLGDPTTQAAERMRDQLIAEGVPSDQILIVPNNQCQRLDEGDPFDQAGSLGDNLIQYGEAADPNSTQSHADEAYVRDYLKRQGYSQADGDRVVMVGHSKGGQQALSVAERMEQAGTPVDQVVTLGTPVAHENLHETPVTHVVALDDDLLFGVVGRFPGIDVAKDERVVVVSGGGHQGYCHNPSIFQEVISQALRDPDGRATGSDRVGHGKTALKYVWDLVGGWFS